MTKRSKTIREIPTNRPETVLLVEMHYALGGWNIFTGDEEPRGYYLAVTPVARKNGCASFRCFSGTQVLIQAAERFAARVLAKLTADETIVQRLVTHVLRKNLGLEVARDTQDA